MTIRGICAACNKTYKVPHDRKEWRCKTCDGPLALEAAPEVSACPKCGTGGNEPGARFCEACGAGLDGQGGARERAPGEKRVAAAEMRKAQKSLRLMRALIVAAIVVTVAAIIPLLTDRSSSARFDLAACVVILVLCIVLLRKLRTSPLATTLSLAMFETLMAIRTAFGTSAVEPHIIKAVLFWSITFQAARLTALAREFPDLYASKRLRGEHLTHGRRSGRRTRADKGSGNQKRWIVYAGVVVAAAAIGYVLLRTPGPDDPQPSLDRFRSAWNAASVEDVAAFARDGSASKMERNFERAMDKYQWNDELPTATSVSVDSQEDKTLHAVLESVAGEVPLRFAWSGERWTLVSISFADVKNWRP